MKVFAKNDDQKFDQIPKANNRKKKSIVVLYVFICVIAVLSILSILPQILFQDMVFGAAIAGFGLASLCRLFSDSSIITIIFSFLGAVFWIDGERLLQIGFGGNQEEFYFRSLHLAGIFGGCIEFLIFSLLPTNKNREQKTEPRTFTE